MNLQEATTSTFTNVRVQVEIECQIPPSSLLLKLLQVCVYTFKSTVINQRIEKSASCHSLQRNLLKSFLKDKISLNLIEYWKSRPLVLVQELFQVPVFTLL